MDWILRLVGSRGAPRAAILERLWTALPPHPPVGQNPIWALDLLGLSQPALADLVNAHQFEQLAWHFPSRGDLNRLVRIAWFGATFGDIACPATSPERESVLREAALFNLAVALFDTIVDDHPSQAYLPKKALAPAALEARLRAPGRGGQVLHCSQPGVSLVVALFDAVLSSIGGRFANDPDRLDYLGGLLRHLYASETEEMSDRTAAKTLPVVFIASIADRSGNPGVLDLLREMGIFCALLDDWQDLGCDILSFQANAFVMQRDGHCLQRVPYAFRALCRLLGGRWSHTDISSRLHRALLRVVRASQRLGGDTSAKTMALLSHLLGLT